MINGHVASKYLYVRIFRGTNKMSQRTFLSLGTWVAITVVLWVIAWIIAEAIPVFNNLLSLITALFASWFTCEFLPIQLNHLAQQYESKQLIMDSTDGLSGLFWLYINKGKYFSSPRKIFLTFLNSFVFVAGATIVSVKSRILKPV